MLCLIIYLGIAGLGAPAWSANSQHYPDGYHLQVHKGQRLLQLKQADEVIQEYAIAYGKGGKGTKRRIGDNRTPQGVYRVAKFKTDSKFHFFIQLSYPNLLDAWYGYNAEIIDAVDFKNIATAYMQGRLPPQSTALGGYIGIHGIGPTTPEKLAIHHAHNWTEGCIALRNEEIMELKDHIRIGTPVIIAE